MTGIPSDRCIGSTRDGRATRLARWTEFFGALAASGCRGAYYAPGSGLRLYFRYADSMAIVGTIYHARPQIAELMDAARRPPQWAGA